MLLYWVTHRFLARLTASCILVLKCIFFALSFFSLSLGALWYIFSPVPHRVDRVRLPSWGAWRNWATISFGNLTELSISFLLCLIYVFICWIAIRGCDVWLILLARALDSFDRAEVLLWKIYVHLSSLERFQVWRKVC